MCVYGCVLGRERERERDREDIVCVSACVCVWMCVIAREGGERGGEGGTHAWGERGGAGSSPPSLPSPSRSPTSEMVSPYFAYSPCLAWPYGKMQLKELLWKKRDSEFENKKLLQCHWRTGEKREKKNNVLRVHHPRNEWKLFDVLLQRQSGKLPATEGWHLI